MDKGPVIELKDPRLVPSLGEGRGVEPADPSYSSKKLG